MRRIAPYAFLLLAAPVLVEVLVGSTTPTSFFTNPIVFFLLVIAYGFPALLIADAIPRWKLSWTGAIMLCFSYGFYNEGVLAKTLFDGHAAAPVFNGYGAFFGLNFPWMLSILTVHAFLSVLFPIVLARELFPETFLKPFLSRNTRVTLLAIIAVLGFLLYGAATKGFSAPLPYLFLFAGAIVAIVTIAKALFGGRGLERRYGLLKLGVAPFAWGVSVPFFFLVVLNSLAGIRANLFLYVLAWAVLTGGFIWLFAKHYRGNLPHLVLFALGAYTGLALLFFVLTGLVSGHHDVVVFNTFAVVILAAIAFRYRKQRATVAVS